MPASGPSVSNISSASHKSRSGPLSLSTNSIRISLSSLSASGFTAFANGESAREQQRTVLLRQPRSKALPANQTPALSFAVRVLPRIPAGAAQRLKLERAQLALLAAIAASSSVSIFAAQVLLAIALALFGVRLARGQTRFQRLPIDAPVLTFCVWTLLSASFSPNPVASHENAKKLVLFTITYLAASSMRAREDRERVLDAVLLGGLSAAGFALLQFYFLGFDTIDNRPRGFLGHYMTASGLAMGILVLGVARLAVTSEPLRRPGSKDMGALAVIAALLAALTLSKRASLFPLEGERLFVLGLAAAAAMLALVRNGWPGPSARAALGTATCCLCAWSLVLSRTRNAWLGTLAGLATIAALRAPRTLLLLPAGLGALLILRPPQLIDRLTLRDASSVDRFYMWQAGIDMVLDKPVFGQGPGMVPLLYARYKWPEAPNPAAPHLHDNFIQIAAERGLPCLGFYMWLLFVLLRDAWRAARDALSNEARERGVPALAVIVAVIVAGAFEYNFGDSEVLMFTLLVSVLPYSHPHLEEAACA